MAGVPIYPSRGRGGGWRLIGGARTDLTGLTESEVTSLLISLSQSRTAAPEHTAAVRKLMRAVPEPFRAGALRVAEATVRDASWGEADDAPERSHVAVLQRAIAARRQVRIGYDGSAARRTRELVPLLVGSRGARWYLLAAPPVSEVAELARVRTYRVDRITSVELLDLAGAAPEGFDPAAEWSRMVERVEGLRGEARAVVRAEPWALRALGDRFGAQARILDGEAGLVEVRAHRVDALAEQLAGWTDAVEVIEPVEVRTALRSLGERLVARYRDA